MHITGAILTDYSFCNHFVLATTIYRNGSRRLYITLNIIFSRWYSAHCHRASARSECQIPDSITGYSIFFFLCTAAFRVGKAGNSAGCRESAAGADCGYPDGLYKDDTQVQTGGVKTGNLSCSTIIVKVHGCLRRSGG